MKQVVVLPSFERSLKKLDPSAKARVLDSLDDFEAFLVSGHMPAGLGFKKVGPNKYEFRVDIRLRVLMKAEAGLLYLILVGNHNNVKRYLRRS